MTHSDRRPIHWSSKEGVDPWWPPADRGWWQCGHVTLWVKSDMHMQVDGEPWLQAGPSQVPPFIFLQRIVSPRLLPQPTRPVGSVKASEPVRIIYPILNATVFGVHSKLLPKTFRSCLPQNPPVFRRSTFLVVPVHHLVVFKWLLKICKYTSNGPPRATAPTPLCVE